MDELTPEKKLAQLYEWRRKDIDLGEMIAIVCEGAGFDNPFALMEGNPEAFEDLWLTCVSLLDQLGEDVAP